MAAPPPSAASPAGKVSTKTHSQHPLAQPHEPRDVCPSSLPSPYRQQPRTAPGPNAFAQKHREEPVQDQGRLRHQASNGGEPYSVSMYKGMQPSPKLHGPPFETPKGESPKSNSSHGISETPGSPTGNAFWQQSEPRSDFWLRLHHERARLDGNVRTRVSPSERETEQLKLVPSPNSNAYATPTHRMELDVKKEQRLNQATQPSTASLSSKALYAPVHTPRHRPRTPTPLKLEHSNKKSTPRSSSSPRKNFFNKLGLGGPTLKPTTPQNNIPLPDPSKPDLTPLRYVPPKAAQLLGTQSLGSRHVVAPAFAKQALTTVTNVSRASLEDVRHTTSAPSNQHSGTRSSESKHNWGSYTKYGEKYRDIDDRVGIQVNPNINRDLSDDRPPTPPSKSTLRERYLEHGYSDTGSTGPSTASDADPIHPALRNSANTPDEGQPKLRCAGYNSRPHIVDPRVANTPRHKSIEPGRDDTKQLPPCPGDSGPRRVLRSSRSPGSAKHSPFKAIPEGGILPTTVYTPSLYGDRFQAGQPSPYSNLSVSPRHLRPVPLNLPPHLRQEQSSQSSGSDDKSRDASNSTSASVPLYLETPSTTNLHSARSGGMPTASSASDQPSESLAPDSSLCVSAGTDLAGDQPSATAFPPPLQTVEEIMARGISPTSSRPRPSYESMTTDHDHDTSLDFPAAGPEYAEGETFYSLPAQIDENQEGKDPVDAEADEDTSRRREVEDLLGAILRDRTEGIKGVERVEGKLLDLCARVEELSVDVRAVLRVVDVNSGLIGAKGMTSNDTAQRDRNSDSGIARDPPEAKQCANEVGNDTLREISGHATWSHDIVGVSGGRGDASTRQLRSLPARLEAPRKGTREYLKGLQQGQVA